MDQYGLFSPVVAALDHALTTVRSVWTDQTAGTYDSINENVAVLAQKIWAAREAAANGEQLVRTYYNEEEWDSALRSIGSRIAEI